MGFEIIKKNEDFHRIIKSGNIHTSRYLVLYILPYNGNINRVGFTVTRKIKGSVKRNRIRRLMKECFRLNQNIIKQGYEMIFLAKQNALDADYYDVRNSIFELFKKAKIMERKK